MTALRTIGILLASLAMIGVAEAQKGGGKPGGGGGGTSAPYSPVIVNVACDGTGAKLQDSLNALNPVANVYEVRVSGVCPENVEVTSFSSIKIKSSNAYTFAKIGTLAVKFGSNLALENIELIGAASSATFHLSASSSLVNGFNLKISCAPNKFCISTNILTTENSQVDIKGLMSGDNIDQVNVQFSRGSSGVLDFGSADSIIECPAMLAVIVSGQSSASVFNAGCTVEKLVARFGGFLAYSGDVPVNIVDVRFGGHISGLDEPWYGELLCSPLGVVSTVGQTTNHCAQ